MGLLLVLTGIAFLNVFEWFSIQALGQWLIETFPGLARVEELMTPEKLQHDLRTLTPGG
jgi:cytochrome c-type biogenesis protein